MERAICSFLRADLRFGWGQALETLQRLGERQSSQVADESSEARTWE